LAGSGQSRSALNVHGAQLRPDAQREAVDVVWLPRCVAAGAFPEFSNTRAVQPGWERPSVSPISTEPTGPRRRPTTAGARQLLAARVVFFGTQPTTGFGNQTRTN